MGSTRRTCRVATSRLVSSCDSLPATHVESPSSRVQRVNAALHDNSHSHNSRARMHGACHVVNSRNSEGDRAGRGDCGPGGTKVLSTSTRCMVGRPAGRERAPLQQAPEKLHVETWTGRIPTSGFPSRWKSFRSVLSR